MLMFIRRRGSRTGLAALLALAVAGISPVVPSALAQAQKEPPAKEVTDGFFDVPPRDPSEIEEPWGLPAYLITAGLAGGAMFILCKSARRS